jgi:hypothetical protein
MAEAIELIDSNFKPLQTRLDSILVKDSVKQLKDSISVKN